MAQLNNWLVLQILSSLDLCYRTRKRTSTAEWAQDASHAVDERSGSVVFLFNHLKSNSAMMGSLNAIKVWYETTAPICLSSRKKDLVLWPDWGSFRGCSVLSKPATNVKVERREPVIYPSSLYRLLDASLEYHLSMLLSLLNNSQNSRLWNYPWGYIWRDAQSRRYPLFSCQVFLPKKYISPNHCHKPPAR
jgi:hypothetical protein